MTTALTRSISIRTPVPGPRSRELVARREAAVPNGLYKAHQIAVESASGALVTDVDGNTFIDFIGGIGVLSQLGLVLLLFVVGLEFDFSHLRRHGRAAAAISLTGIAVPLALGIGLAALAYPHLEAVNPGPGQQATAAPRVGFLLFMGVAMSITAIPVLGRIMMELNITRTRLGATSGRPPLPSATRWASTRWSWPDVVPTTTTLIPPRSRPPIILPGNTS